MSEIQESALLRLCVVLGASAVILTFFAALASMFRRFAWGVDGFTTFPM